MSKSPTSSLPAGGVPWDDIMSESRWVAQNGKRGGQNKNRNNTIKRRMRVMKPLTLAVQQCPLKS